MLIALVVALEITRKAAQVVAETCDKTVEAIMTHEIRFLTGIDEDWSDHEL